MDQIPVIAVEPAVLNVIHEELEVRRHPSRLDRAEIYSHDRGAGIAVGDFCAKKLVDDTTKAFLGVASSKAGKLTIDSPYSGTCTKIDDFLRVVAYRSVEQLSTRQDLSAFATLELAAIS